MPSITSSLAIALVAILSLSQVRSAAIDDDDEGNALCRTATSDSCRNGLESDCKARCAEVALNDCCRENGVSEDCIHICHYGRVNKEELCEGNKRGCNRFTNMFNYCGGRGVSAENCCRAANIPEECMTLCQSDKNLSVDKLFSMHKCLELLGTISKCKKKTYKGKFSGTPVAKIVPEEMTPEDSFKYQQLFGTVC